MQAQKALFSAAEAGLVEVMQVALFYNCDVNAKLKDKGATQGPWSGALKANSPVARFATLCRNVHRHSTPSASLLAVMIDQNKHM